MQKSKKIQGWLRDVLLIVIFITLLAPVSTINIKKTVSENSATQLTIPQDTQSYTTNIKSTYDETLQDGLRGTYTIHTLSDGSTKKNLTFTGAGDITDSFIIPRNATATSATMDLAGYPVNLNPTFNDDFNDGNLAGWTVSTQGSGVIQISGDQYHSLPYSMRMYSPSGTSSLAMATNQVIFNPAATDYNVSFYFRLTSTPNHWFDVFVNAPQILTVIDSGNVFTYRYGGTNVPVMTFAINQWYHIQYTTHLAQSNYGIYVDGVYKATAPFCGGGGNPQTFTIGDFESGIYNYGEAFWDDFVITPWIMSDDFNDNNLDGWTVTTLGSGTVQNSATQYHTAPYSMRMYSPSSPASEAKATYQMSTLNITKNYNVSFYFFIPTTAHHWFDVFTNPPQTTTVIDTSYQFIYRTGGNNYLIMTLTPNIWYRMDYYIHPSSQTYDIYVNSQFKVTASFNGESGNPQTFRIGDWDPGTSNYGEGFWDDFVVVQPPIIPSYPLNPSLDVGNDGDLQWSHAGSFTTKETTPDFAAEINQYLSNQPPGNGTISVPLKFHSDAAGKLEISNIAITYTQNQPPYTPSNPTPSNGATGISINADLSWSGGDPDPGDTVTYDVYFSTINPPAIKVSANQTSTTYDPGVLGYNTKYYWKIIAHDNHGATTPGPVWNFTTQPNQSPNQPSTPSGPTSVKIKQTATYTASTTDPEGDQIYYMWDWGDSTNTSWLGPYSSGYTIIGIHAWFNQGTFPVKIKAKDVYGHESPWSNSLLVGVTPVSSNWLGNTRLTANDGFLSEYPATAKDSQGNINIVWQDNRNGNWEIYYKKINKTGIELVSDTRLTNNNAASEYPDIAIDSTNNIHIVWQDRRDISYEIYYTKLNPNGTTLIDDTRITTNDGMQSLAPSIQVGNNNFIHVAWQDYRDSNWEIYYKKMDVNGNDLTGEVRMTNQLANSEQPVLAVYQDTLAHITWQDNRDGNYEIYHKDAFVDLVPISISYLNSNPPTIHQHLAIVNQPIIVTAVVANKGTIPVSNAHVEVYLDTNNIYTGTSPLILPNATVSIQFTWLPNQQGRHNFTVYVDPLSQIADINRDNNILNSYVPVADLGNVHDDPWAISSSYPQQSNKILACTQLSIGSYGSLDLENSDLIAFGPSSSIQINGGFQAHGAFLTTSYPTEHTSLFEISGTAPVDITGCAISNLGNNGLTINRAIPVTLNGNLFTDCNTALTYQTGTHTCNNNTILWSTQYDFNVGTNTQLTVLDSFFDSTKVHVATSTSSYFLYQKHMNGHFINETGQPAIHARVYINDSRGVTVYSGFTDVNGNMSMTLLPVFNISGSLPQINYTPLNVSLICSGPVGGSFQGSWGTGGLMGSGMGGFFGQGTIYSVARYALLIAGITGIHPGDVYAYWDDVAYMYHVLKDVKGYDPKNIQVVFTDGNGTFNNANKMINYSATRANLIKAFQYIGGKIKNDASHRDHLLIYVTDHGGATNTICMNNGDDITDTQFASMVDTYIGNKASMMVIVMNQCYGASFIDNLHGINRTIQTATNAWDSQVSIYQSWDMSINGQWHNGGHAYFSVEYISAIHNTEVGKGYYPDQGVYNYPTDCYSYPDAKSICTQCHTSPISSGLDTDNNKAISFHEAFTYALNHDLQGPSGTKDESPLEVDDDTIVVGTNNGYIYSYIYNGDGTVGSIKLYLGDAQLQIIKKMVVTDMNFDGSDDIVFIGGNNLNVWLNNGDWTFSSHTYTVIDPQSLLVDEFNNDWRPDVAVLSGSQCTVQVFMNKRDGTLDAHKDYTVAQGPVDLTAIDFNGDGYKDFAVANDNGKGVSILLNKGMEGGFNNAAFFPIPGPAKSITAGDIDQDNDNDLVVPFYNTSQSSYKLALLKNEGGQIGWSKSVIGTDTTAYWVYPADINNDGKMDVVTAAAGANTIAWYENSGGIPIQWIKHTISTAVDGPLCVYVADLDNDGKLDVISASNYDDKVAWYHNDGGNPPSWTAHTITTSADGASSLSVADLDADGDLDVISSSRWDNRIAWYENTGGNPLSWTMHTITTSAFDVRCVFAAKVNDDDRIDILAGSVSDDTVAWYENQGGSPPTFVQRIISNKLYDGPGPVCGADLDGDGDCDVIAGLYAANKIVWYENMGGATPIWRFHYLKDAGSIANYAKGPFSICIKDMDKDGDLDVVAANRYSNITAWYENDGSPGIGQWVEHIISASTIDVRRAVPVDLDGDGNMDVVTASDGDNTFAWHTNGRFSLYLSTLSSAKGPQKSLLYDLDGDGRLDLIVLNKIDHCIRLYKNTGSASIFMMSQDINVGPSPTDFFMTDLDGDNDLDMVVTCATNVTILRNTSPFNFQICGNTQGVPYSVSGTNRNNVRSWYP